MNLWRGETHTTQSQAESKQRELLTWLGVTHPKVFNVLHFNKANGASRGSTGSTGTRVQLRGSLARGR